MVATALEVAPALEVALVTVPVLAAPALMAQTAPGTSTATGTVTGTSSTAAVVWAGRAPYPVGGRGFWERSSGIGAVLVLWGVRVPEAGLY